MNTVLAQRVAFAVIEAIDSGECDPYLLRLRAAINQRLASDEYKRS